MHSRADELLQALGMRPHPEGGHYVELFRSAQRVQVLDRNIERSALTTIYFLLAAGEFSRWHRVVSDEIGSPTFAPDLARAIAGLLANGRASGVLHVVNAGAVSRADWAREILRQAGVDEDVEDIASRAWPRASTPPAWAVLASDVPLRPWSVALAEYLATLG